MTDAFDVSLRVKLDYQAGAAARTAVADLGAIESTAKRLGAASSVLAVARDLGELRKGADVARAGIQDLAAAGAKLGQAGAPAKLATALATVSDGATAARRAIVETAEAAAKLGTANPAGRMAVEMDRAAKAAGSLEAEIDALVASAGKLTACRPAQMEAAMRAFDAQVKSGRVQLGALEEAANKVGTASGPRHLGERLAGVASNAAEARREVDFVGVAAAKAARDLDKLGTARAHAGSGDAGGGAPAAGGRHAGPGGVRGALMAGARPLHMERLLASAMTPTGLMGLGAGLGVAGIAHEIEDATHRAIDFEDAMNGLRRTVGDISPERMKALEGEILRTSRATGVATGDLAAMASTASAAGRPFAEIPQFMDLGAKAAGALGIKADEAAEALTRIGADFKLDGNGLRSVLDAVATLQERTGASGAGSLDFLSRVGPVAGLARMQPAQAAAFGGAMQQAGMSPDQSAGLFGDVLTKLLSGEKGGDAYMNGLHKMRAPDGDGETAFALQRLARVDPSAAMVRFLGDVKTLSRERRFSVLSEIVGPEQAEALSRVSEHVGEITRNLGIAQDTGAQRGGLDRVFKLFDDATSKKIDRATQAIGAFATKVGQALAPAVGAAADATARLFGQLADGPKGAMDAGTGAGDTLGNWTGKSERSSAFAEMLKEHARNHGAHSDAEVEAWIKTNRPRDYDGVYRPEHRSKDDAYTPQHIDPVLRDVQPAQGRPANVEALKRAESFLARQLAEAKPEQATGIRRQLDEVRRQLGGGAPLPAFAGGGQVRGPGGPTGDKILARLSDEEFVVNARATRKHLGTLQAINDDTLPAFATGGAVGALAMASATGTADPAALDRLTGAVQAGVKMGVVAGLRDSRDLPGFGTGAGFHASSAPGDGGGAANLRYGRAGGAAGRASLRYGRTPSGGYRLAPGGDGSDVAPGHYRSTPSGPAPLGDHGRAGGGAAPSDGAPPGDGSSIDWSAAVLRKKEGFIGRAQWDVNHYRLGYGTDTITRPDGSVHEVQRGDTVTREDAERDLKRRIPQFQATLRKQVGGASWDRLDPATQGALTSVGYNYGGFVPPRGRSDYMKPLRDAVSSGDRHRIADAVRGLQGQNGGVNRQRRLEEASIIDSGHLPASWHARDPVQRQIARDGGASSNGRFGAVPGSSADEDRATRSVAMARPISPRFTDPGLKSAYDRGAPAAGSTATAAAGRGGAGNSTVVQHFHGQHDPRETARHAMREANRNIGRARGRALHGIGALS